MRVAGEPAVSISCFHDCESFFFYILVIFVGIIITSDSLIKLADSAGDKAAFFSFSRKN